MSPTARPPSRWTLYLPFIVLALIVAVHGVYWMIAAGEVRASAQRWIEEQEAAGYALAHEGLSVGGYPFRFILRAEAPDIAAPPADGGWSARFSELRAAAQFYNFNHWIVELEGPGEVAAPGEAGLQRFSVDMETARMSLRTQNGATNRIGADVRALALTPLADTPAAPALRGLDRLALTGHLDNADVLSLRIQIEGAAFADAVLEPEIQRIFGGSADLLRMEAAVTAWSALAAEGDPATWERAEGSLNVAGAQIAWGPAEMSGSGEIGLDSLLRPAGRLSVIVADPETLITALVEAGLIHAEQGDMLRVAAMVAPQREGGASLPFRFQDGALFLGPVRLGSLEAVQ